MNTEHPGPDGFGHWRKSSFSEPNGNACVEVAWRKSSYSEPNGNECVEVAFGQVAVGLRDSKNPAGPRLVFDHGHWLTFVGQVGRTRS